jgi:hypothetical protein
VPFVKGQSGCSTGRGGAPGKGEFTRALLHAIHEIGNDRRPLGDYKKIERIVMALIDKALEGDVPAIREVADRIEGRVPTPILDDGNDGRPMMLVVRWGNRDRIANDDALPMLELKANGNE